MSKEGTKKPLTKAQKAALRKKRKNKKILMLVIEVLVLLILAVVLFVVIKFSRIEKDNSFTPADIEINEGISEESREIMEKSTTIALFGLDAANSNSDVIMIATINNETKEVKLCSVYRDTYLDVGGGEFRKCNYAYPHGGAEKAINMLNTNLDLNITDYVAVDFNAVVACVDLLGGVEVEITDEEAILMQGYMDEISKITKKKSQYLPGAGRYNMDGVQACAYARIRYTAGDDYKRAERQRIVIAAMVDKAQRSNLKTINSLINEVFGDIKTSYSSADLLALASQVFSYNLGETSGFPFEKNSKTLASKGSIVAPCDLESNVVQLHVFLYGDETYMPTETVKANSAKIINDTGFRQGDGY